MPAAARAARIASSARSPSAARVLTSRIPPDPTRPARPDHAARAAQRYRPGSPAQCQRRGQVRHDLARIMHHPRRPPLLQGRGQAPAQAGHRSVSHSRTAPAWDTRPRPSADTATRLLPALLFI